MNIIKAGVITLLMFGNLCASRTMQCDENFSHIIEDINRPVQLFSIYDPKLTNEIVHSFLTDLQDAIMSENVNHLMSACDQNTLWIHGNNAYRVSLIDRFKISIGQVFTSSILELIMNATLQKIVVSNKGLQLGEGQIQIGISKSARDKPQYASTDLKFISIRTS